MALHMIAYSSSVLTKGTLQSLTPVPDVTVTVNGKDIYVPAKYNMLAAAIDLTRGAQAHSRAQVQSPSLRQVYFPDLSRLNLGNTVSGAYAFEDYSDNPIALATNEGLEYWSDGGGDGTTAQDAMGILLLTDSKIAPAPNKHVTIRATGAAALAAGQWVNTALTFDQTLPVGTYDIIGMRAVGANLAAARLVFIGASAVTRPGVPGASAETAAADLAFRHGNFGVFGTFDSVTPPSVDCLGVTDTAQTFYFDLVKH